MLVSISNSEKKVSDLQTSLFECLEAEACVILLIDVREVALERLPVGVECDIGFEGKCIGVDVLSSPVALPSKHETWRIVGRSQQPIDEKDFPLVTTESLRVCCNVITDCSGEVVPFGFITKETWGLFTYEQLFVMMHRCWCSDFCHGFGRFRSRHIDRW